MPPGHPPGRFHRGPGIDRALPARARVAAPLRPAHRGGRRASAPSGAATSPSTSRGWRHPRPHACVRSSACADDGSARMRRLCHPLARASPPARADRQHNWHPRLPEHQQPRLHRPLSHPPRSARQRTPPVAPQPVQPALAASPPAHTSPPAHHCHRPKAHHRHQCARPSDVAPTVRVPNQPASLSPSTSTSPSPSPSLSISFSYSRFGCSCWAFQVRQESTAPLGT